jgi:DNA-binding NarL/FixJ family response regulator
MRGCEGLFLLVRKANEVVAADLGISIGTVETPRTKIMQKLGLHSLAEFVPQAIREKLVTLPSSPE